MQAIETKYHGHKFRSRTEARWAVFFDALGIKWDYEKDGFDLGEQGMYLPDFWLPESKVYAEVKGQEFTTQEVNRCRILALRSSYPVVMLAGSPEGAVYYAEMPNGLLGTHQWATDSHTLSLAVDRAKTARFEHGETPSIEKVVARVMESQGVRRAHHMERGASAERELIRGMLYARSRVEQIAEKLGDESFREPQYRAIYRALIAAGPDVIIDDVVEVLDEHAKSAIEDLMAEGSYQIDPARTISDSLATLRARDLDLRAAELDRIIPLVEPGAEKEKLIEEKDEIRKELKETGRNYYKKFKGRRA